MNEPQDNQKPAEQNPSLQDDSKPVRKHSKRYIASRIAQKKKNTKLDVAKALILKNKGLSYRDIAKQFDCSTNAVFLGLKKLNKHLLTPADSSKFNELESRLLSSARSKIIAHALDDKTLKKANFLQAMTGYAICLDKQRLISGQSTHNILSVMIRSAHDSIDRNDDSIKIENAKVIDNKEIK